MNHRKFYHVVAEKNSHFYYEIFEKKETEINNVFKAIPVISEFCTTTQDICERTFTFKNLFDLKHSNSKNAYLQEIYNENRLWFLSSREAIDVLHHCYNCVRQEKITATLNKLKELEFNF